MKKIGILFILWFGFSPGVFAEPFSETAGDFLLVALPAGAYYATVSKDDKKGRFQLLKGFVTSGLITAGLKGVVHKTRPNGEPQSFPSGHTSLTFAAAGFLQQRYGWNLGLPAYLVAGFVGWSRVDSDNHYESDVLAGAIIGWASSRYFTKAFTDSVAVMPQFNHEKVSLNFQLLW